MKNSNNATDWMQIASEINAEQKARNAATPRLVKDLVAAIHNPYGEINRAGNAGVIDRLLVLGLLENARDHDNNFYYRATAQAVAILAALTSPPSELPR